MSAAESDRKAALEELFAIRAKDSDYFIQHRYRMKYRPMYGGVFGGGRFELASYLTERSGLHHVMFLVVEPKSWLAISVADSKQDALERARYLLSGLKDAGFLFLWDSMCGAREKAQTKALVEREMRLRETQRKALGATDKVKSISRRRRKIFDESGGKCHYCAATLTLDGKWHVEHKFPRALGGTDEPNNLVASCVACNYEKRDTTDIEYKTKRAMNGRAAA